MIKGRNRVQTRWTPDGINSYKQCKQNIKKRKEKQLSKLKNYSIDLLVNESLLFIDWYLEKREGVLISSDQKKEFIHIFR